MVIDFFRTHKKCVRILTHFLFWGSYLLFMLAQYNFLREKTGYTSTLVSLSLTLPVDILATYFTVYFLLTQYLFKRKYLLFAVLFVLSATCFILMQRMIMYYIVYPSFYPDKTGSMVFFRFNYLYSLVNIYMIAGFFMAIKLLKYWYENQQIRMELEAQNKDSEIALLRNQINPHFLFNTLNNIDTLISENQEEASDAIMRLSEIMRYMLYDSNTRYVPLQKELSYLESYIALQKIRLKNPDVVRFEIGGNEKNKRVAPMLLIPFVENAFKHGAGDASAKGVYIGLRVSKDHLDFIVENAISIAEQSSKDIAKGIGLTNVTRRLELIYKDHYQLETTAENNKFRVHLRINFNENQLHSR